MATTSSNDPLLNAFWKLSLKLHNCSLFPLIVPYFNSQVTECPLITGLPAYFLPNNLLFPIHFTSKCLQAPSFLPTTPTFCHNISDGWGVQGHPISTQVDWTSTVTKEQLLNPFPFSPTPNHTLECKWPSVMLLLGRSWKYKQGHTHT